jgi:hypothetical protein
MAEAFYGIETERPDLARRQAESENRKLTDVAHLNPELIREPDYQVYIFSVADRDFNVSRPTLNISRVTFSHNPDCISNPEAYQYVMPVSSPYALPYSDQNSGEIRLNTVVGEKAAMDLINPNQKSLDMDGYIAADAEYNIGLGDDLIRKGLFFVSDNPRLPKEKRPTFVGPDGKPCKFDLKDKEGRVIAKPVPPKDELKKAVTRKEKYYNNLLDRMKGYEYSSPQDLDDFRRAEPDVHLACEYFGVETSWHQKRTQKISKVECRLCGGEMVKGAAYHALPGTKLGVCVHNWDAAIEAGVVAEEDRPKKKASKAEIPA